MPPAVDNNGRDLLTEFTGQIVVLDTQGPLLYIGTLKDVRPDAVLLEQVDVHDSNDSRSSKDLYLAETRTLGVHANRALVIVRREIIASVSRLEDVLS